MPHPVDSLQNYKYLGAFIGTKPVQTVKKSYLECFNNLRTRSCAICNILYYMVQPKGCPILLKTTKVSGDIWELNLSE